MMEYTVRAITDKAGMRDFINVPYHIYRDDPTYVAPLRTELERTLDATKNPYFKGVDLQKYVCYRAGQPIARAISVINPRHWEKFGRKTAFFGFYESENDAAATTTLFSAVGADCSRKGAEFLEGPFNPNHYSELGLLTRNFTAPVFFETYNPQYYSALLEQAGFRPVRELHTRRNPDARGFMNRKPARSLASLQTNGFRIRPFNLFHLKADLECIREVFNDAFSENWHFLPLSSQEYSYSAQGLFLVTRPSLIQIVEHYGKPVGVLQCVLNINPLLAGMRGRLSLWKTLQFLWRRPELQEMVIYAIGIKKTYRNSRVFVLLYEALRQMVQRYPVLSTTWMGETNLTAVKASELAGLQPYKWFSIYEKPLIPPSDVV